MTDLLAPAITFDSNDFYNPQATISLSDTTLRTSLMTPEATSPEPSQHVKEENVEADDAKKPTKKRKSWGQELPTPKTNLPPRYVRTTSHPCSHLLTPSSSKRAKTEDEKEQRRIERVLRNRQAAQSSRERKRQEVEKLEGEKSFIERQNESLKERLMAVEHEKFLLTQKLAKMTAQLESIKRGSSGTSRPTSPRLGGLPDSTSTGSDLLGPAQFIKQELLEEYPYDLPTPQNSYAAPSSNYSSPSSGTCSSSSTPATVSLGVGALTTSSDMTQHPAAMLCDLQCQSQKARQTATQPTTPRAAVTPSSSANRLSLMLISAVYSQLMHPLRMIFITLRTGSPLPPSMTTMPMVLLLIRWLISTPASLLPPTPTTGPTTPTHPPKTPSATTTTTTTTTKTSPAKASSTPEATRSRVPILRLRLLRRLLLSSPSLARPLRAATGRASRLKTGSMTSGTGARGLSERRVARCGDQAGGRKGGVCSVRGSNGTRSGSSRGNSRVSNG